MKNRKSVVTGIVYNHRKTGLHYGRPETAYVDRSFNGFTIITTGGSEDMFREWFLEVAGGDILNYSDSMEFREVGVSKWELEEGAEISITFDEYLDALLSRLASNAHNVVNHLAWQALMSIGKN